MPVDGHWAPISHKLNMRALARAIVADIRYGNNPNGPLHLEPYYVLDPSVLVSYTSLSPSGPALAAPITSPSESDAPPVLPSTVRTLASSLVSSVVPLGMDAATEDFVRTVCLRSRAMYALKDMAHTLLTTCFLSATNASTLLGKGTMWVLSTHQIGTLLRAADHAATTDRMGMLASPDPLAWDALNLPRPDEWSTWDADPLPRGTLLDVGAGAGSVTAQLAPYATTVVATETAAMNVWSLKNYGFAALSSGTLHDHELRAALEGAGHVTDPQSPLTFDIVSCFNVLDRCDTPVSLLNQMVSLLNPHSGRLILSIVLPYHASVEVGGGWETPSEFLQAPFDDNAPFESWVLWFVATFLTPAGLQVLSWSRVPYISPGNSHHAFFVLYNAVFVCGHAP